MIVLKKLLKMLLWLIGSGILLIVLTLAGFYVYFAILMQGQFAKLEINTSTDCTTSARWQIFMPINAYPTRFPPLFEELNGDAIDDQLARMLIDDGVHYRNLERLARHAVGILEIKRHYLADERLEFAMKHWYMGKSDQCRIHGMEAATHYYLGKTSTQLSVAEMVFLAGLAKGASVYNPFIYPDRALDRRNRVLETLRNDQLITTAEYQAALNEPLPTEPHLP